MGGRVGGRVGGWAGGREGEGVGRREGEGVGAQVGRLNAGGRAEAAWGRGRDGGGGTTCVPPYWQSCGVQGHASGAIQRSCARERHIITCPCCGTACSVALGLAAVKITCLELCLAPLLAPHVPLRLTPGCQEDHQRPSGLGERGQQDSRHCGRQRRPVAVPRVHRVNEL